VVRVSGCSATAAADCVGAGLLSASDDLRDPARLRSLLEDLREIRQVKARRGFEQLVAGAAIRVRVGLVGLPM
jgi:hypothetical protein